MSSKKTLVLGASENPQRYSYLAVQKLLAHQHPVVAIGKKEGKVHGIEIWKDQKIEKEIDTVTLYLNPENQKKYYDYILQLNPRRIIFNPGTENDELVSKAAAKGIQTLEACTLVLLSTGQY
ncbi:MAG: CoA-binding protein [Ferruginibacter sp.]|nr:CoA-binding protein [Ferruginibacter sp.]